MGHFLDRLAERAPEINHDRAIADIKEWKARDRNHSSFDLVGTSAKGSMIYRYVQGGNVTYLVLDARYDNFCTVYTQEFVRAMRKAAKRRKKRRSAPKS